MDKSLVEANLVRNKPSDSELNNSPKLLMIFYLNNRIDQQKRVQKKRFDENSDCNQN